MKKMKKKPFILVILDGFGISHETRGNAIALAKKPFYDSLLRNYPHTQLKASGEAVGVPKGTIGNSEVGHLNIGAGRLVEQEITRINRAIQNGNFFKNKVFMDTVKRIKEKNTTLHIMGLLSDGGVHSHINHLLALIEFCSHHNLEKVYIHCFLDGRDVNPMSAKKYVRILQKEMEKLGTGEIATIIGRYYAMDRDNRWNREHKAYDLMVNGKGISVRDPMEAINLAYTENTTDEFVKPTLINPNGLVKEHDSIIFFNFRSDRARQITRTFTEGKFQKFRRKQLIDLDFVCMVEYDKHFKLKVAFPPQEVKNCLSEVLSKNHLKQLKVAETEKYAHVTYFLNGGNEVPFKNEDRIVIKSPKVSTYDLKPEMSAHKVTETVVNAIKKNKYDAIIMNFANGDMVGHSGKIAPTIKAVEVMDKCLSKIIPEIEKKKGIAVITADHGNAECKEDKFGNPQTAHTLNPVPFIVTKKGLKLKPGILGDIAPTILKLLKIKKPKEMKGKSLF